MQPLKEGRAFVYILGLRMMLLVFRFGKSLFGSKMLRSMHVSGSQPLEVPEKYPILGTLPLKHTNNVAFWIQRMISLVPELK